MSCLNNPGAEKSNIFTSSRYLVFRGLVTHQDDSEEDLCNVRIAIGAPAGSHSRRAVAMKRIFQRGWDMNFQPFERLHGHEESEAEFVGS